MVSGITNQITAAQAEISQLQQQQREHASRRDELVTHIAKRAKRHHPSHHEATLRDIDSSLAGFPGRLQAVQARIAQLVQQRDQLQVAPPPPPQPVQPAVRSGLANVGATCYMNAMLQLLVHSRCYDALLHQDSPISRQLNEIVTALRDPAAPAIPDASLRNLHRLLLEAGYVDEQPGNDPTTLLSILQDGLLPHNGGLLIAYNGLEGDQGHYVQLAVHEDTPRPTALPNLLTAKLEREGREIIGIPNGMLPITIERRVQGGLEIPEQLELHEQPLRATHVICGPGHYTFLTRMGEEWWCYDDAAVQRIGSWADVSARIANEARLICYCL